MNGGISSNDVKNIFSEIAEKYDRTRWWRRRINMRINSPIQRKIRPPSDAVNVLERDWDTLVVLDACRADLFEDLTNDADLGQFIDRKGTIRSIASSTPEWLQRTFGQSHGDIVYVAGNPMVSKHKPESFHELVEIWRDAYDSDTNVISPESVTAKGLKMRSEYPNKRLILHYMQPHYPFIDRPNLNYSNISFEKLGLDSGGDNTNSIILENGHHVGDVWGALEEGLVQENEVWEGYSHNLSVALGQVQRLIRQIDDRIVITSDHGNMLGGRSWPIPTKIFGHPRDHRNKGLINVPWAIVRGESRTIIEETVTSSPSSASKQEIEDHLSELGYLE
jgi:hypothetical protein